MMKAIACFLFVERLLPFSTSSASSAVVPPAPTKSVAGLDDAAVPETTTFPPRQEEDVQRDSFRGGGGPPPFRAQTVRPRSPLFSQTTDQIPLSRSAMTRVIPVVPNKSIPGMTKSIGKTETKVATTTSSNKTNRVVVVVASLVTVATITALRGHWMPFVSVIFDKKQLQARAMQLMQDLRPDSGSALQCLQSHSVYAFAIAVWELMGLSTVPLETAAGMVFGWAGMAAGICGKLLGASAAFFVGRWHLREQVLRKFSNHPACAILLKAASATTQGSKENHRHPGWLSALLMKFSILPGMCKTFGTAVFLPNVTYGSFLAATGIYSVLFTTLLTLLGLGASQKLAGAGATVAAAGGGGGGASRWAMMGLITVWGIAPITTGWWVQDLRKGVTSAETVSAQPETL